MKILVISGSRADAGLLEWPVKLMREDPFFTVQLEKIWGSDLPVAFSSVNLYAELFKPDAIMLLGDRHEILGAACAAHLKRIPISHLCGGDITKGSYDDAMRDCISRLARWHFTTSAPATARLMNLGHQAVHCVGSTGLDYILKADWRKPRHIEEPYIVVSYQPETIDGTNEIHALLESLPAMRKIIVKPNFDVGSHDISQTIEAYCALHPEASCEPIPERDDFLNTLLHCEEFIGNSSAILYEAPALGIKTRLIGKRQEGRVVPWGDGKASERIIKVLKGG